MALIPCPECGQQISTLATLCPHCGAPRTPEAESMDQEKIAAGVPGTLASRPHRDVHPWVIAAAIIVGLLLLIVAVNSGRDGSNPAPQSLEKHDATLAISDAGHPCGAVVNAARLASGGIHTVCSNGETYRILTIQGKTIAMRCSAVKSLGIEGCG